MPALINFDTDERIPIPEVPEDEPQQKVIPNFSSPFIDWYRKELEKMPQEQLRYSIRQGQKSSPEIQGELLRLLVRVICRFCILSKSLEVLLSKLFSSVVVERSFWSILRTG